MEILKRLKPGDFLIVVILLIISFTPFFMVHNSKKEGNQVIAIVKVNNRQVKKLSLDHDQKWQYQRDGKINILQVKNHKIRAIDANCKDQVCVKEGWKSKSGDTIVCLPHKFLVELKNENQIDDDK
ncbi:NusG domain II-containing protein [Lactobacillus helsingborgensis]|uniref:NusG domain II-containing protein n=1 Tax=Lactobacillus TaxID=1578 RepID=UPI000D6F42E1|nr:MULTISPECIES: NusG domain II-containing protein [Lactobacillus]AWN32865.1 NusG domain II-containing protein [Lactobacillus helsingborgensis]MBC6356613.1 NusG domain II-containing protein [Lactobacillus helsingborgensis]RMC54497.1 NusG domain II-containing protein [Lactobacillus sp. ESL0262]WLT00644.1 NusG domain II-containing protein [Lactobacillus helsingborgensis]